MQQQQSSMTPCPGAGRAWYAVGVLFIAVIFSFIDRIILSLLVDPIKADLGLTDTDFAFLLGVAFAVFFATTLAQYWNLPGIKPPIDVAFGLEARSHYEHRAFPELVVFEAFNRIAGRGSGAEFFGDGPWRTKVRDDLYLEPLLAAACLNACATR